MARKNLNEVVSETTSKLSKLSELVSRWGANKIICDGLEKSVKADAAEIKQIMLVDNMTSFSSEKFTANLSFQNKESMDEEGLLEYIKTVLWADMGSMECPYIKRIEVLDWDAIERDTFSGKITKEQLLEMDKFKTTTKTPVLKLKVSKEG